MAVVGRLAAPSMRDQVIVLAVGPVKSGANQRLGSVALLLISLRERGVVVILFSIRTAWRWWRTGSVLTA
jgi:hypothetical protein